MKRLIPRDAMKLDTYEQLREVLVELCYQRPELQPGSVQIYGPPEVGKTEMVKSIFDPDNSYWAPSHLTSLTLYASLYENLDKTFILDDPNTDDDTSVTMEILMKVTERTPTKTLTRANTPQLRATGAPPRFETKSRVLCIANPETQNRAAKALASRTDTYWFVPTPESWLKHVGSYWPQDEDAQEVLTYVRDRADRIWRYGCRMMDKALCARRGNRVHVPWTRYLDPMFRPV